MSRARLRENSSTSTLPIFIGSWDGDRTDVPHHWPQGWLNKAAKAGPFTLTLSPDMARADRPRKASLWASGGGKLCGFELVRPHWRSLFRHITGLAYGLGRALNGS